MPIIYKLCPSSLWREAEAAGVFHGMQIDFDDGYIHFSTGTQVRETARLYFAGREDLVLVAIDAEPLGEALKYEASRGGDRFPHLHAPLDLAAVVWVKELPLGSDGLHRFPDELP
jgi:uncharacterized protein (DUF952 family)